MRSIATTVSLQFAEINGFSVFLLEGVQAVVKENENNWDFSWAFA